MERVQFQQEQMLAELKDLMEKGLFTKVEIKQIMKKRTEFETALVRRIAKKTDYLRYAAYEMDLENLRKKRAARIIDKPSPPSVSDYALVRRQFHIFERACRKFKSDVGMWIQYIQLADKMGARALVGKITAKALQLHPNVPSLYILAASHELHSLSTSAARTLLQRGIRLNPDEIQLWTEYVKMELGFIEGLRRRWNILGLDMDTDPNERHGGDETEALEADDVEKATETGRRRIMHGEIVKSVMINAVEALPKVELLRALKELISGYPLPETLRDGLLNHLYALSQQHLGDDPEAVSMSVTRFMGSGTGIVEALQHSNEEFVQAVRRSQGHDGMCSAYARFVEEWCKKEIDANMKLYLLSSVGSLGDEFEKQTELVAARLRILASSHPALVAPEKILRIVRKVTCKSKTTSGDVWIARLEAESRFGSQGEVEKAWADARRNVRGAKAQEVWMWGVDRSDSDESGRDVLEGLLRESMRDPALRSIHGTLLMRYVKEPPACGDARIRRIRHAGESYLMSPEVWAAMFREEKERSVLEEIRKNWRRVDGRGAEDAWGRYLQDHGRMDPLEARMTDGGARSRIQ